MNDAVLQTVYFFHLRHKPKVVTVDNTMRKPKRLMVGMVLLFVLSRWTKRIAARERLIGRPHDRPDNRLGKCIGTMKIDADLGGQIVNSRGQKNAEAWGMPAEWVDYTGPVAGETVGLAIFSHPANFRHPCLWHVRNYGLFAANPFGDHHFPETQVQQGAVTIPAGDSLTLRYRVVLHRYNTQKADIQSLYEKYMQNCNSQ